MATPEKGLSIGRIDYLNVAPVYHGFNTSELPSGKIWHVVSKPPGTLNRMLADKQLDISAISAAAYAHNADDWQLLPNLSIGCAGPVMSVLLVSRKPMNCLHGEAIRLTQESASAALLLQLLIKDAGMVPLYHQGKVRSVSDAEDVAAALVIGDAALTEPWDSSFPYVYDLGVLWQEDTGLPFVFGLWAVRQAVCEKQLSDVKSVCRLFEASLASGLARIDDIIEASSQQYGLSTEVLQRYFKVLNYHLPESQIQGLKLFYDRLYKSDLIPRPVNISFFNG